MNFVFKRVVVTMAMAALLFAQLAVAAYACPNLPLSGATLSEPSQSAAPCAHPNPAQPGLCRAHCMAEPQSIDKIAAPDFPVMLTRGLVISLMPDRSIAAPAVSIQTSLLTHAAGPPLAIRHCCFRI